MGHRFNWQAFLSSFSPYLLVFGYEPELPTSIWWDVMAIINLDDPNVWIQTCEQQATLFQCVMPMAMENLAIAQHWNTLRYATMCGGGYRPLNSKVWTKKLCLFVANNIDYFGCDCMTCYFMCVEGFTFRSVVVGGPKWLDMEGLCVQLCWTMSSSQCGWPS
jgi:hypothetical protein